MDVKDIITKVAGNKDLLDKLKTADEGVIRQGWCQG